MSPIGSRRSYSSAEPGTGGWFSMNGLNSDGWFSAADELSENPVPRYWGTVWNGEGGGGEKFGIDIARNFDVSPYPPSRSFWLSVDMGF